MSVNVRALANGAIQVVNQNITAAYRASIGSTNSASGKRTPNYAASVDVQIQAQAAKGKDLEHVTNLNVQNVYRSVRMWGNTQGVVRPDAKGGDLLTFPQVPGGPARVWLVVAVLETWKDWCSLVVEMQTDSVP